MITRILGFFLLLLLFKIPLLAVETPPSDASLKQLLEVAHAHQMLDATLAQMETMMKNVFQQVTAGQAPSPAMQKIFEKAEADVMVMCRKELTWEKLEPMYLRIYRKSLTQSEVDGMTAFYRTDAGQAVINKMPVILQNSMSEVSQMMGPMVQRAQQMQKDLVAELQAEKAKAGG